jgi:plasmid stability protein
MARDDPQMKIRLPDELKEQIEMSAKEWGRSMNAEIVHMLQSYYKHLDDGVQSMQRGLELDRQESISFGLKDGRDRAAVIHVLRLQEIALLKRRIEQLGGRDAVLGMTKGEAVKRIEGPRIKGTHEEQTTYFSQTIGTTPLTAILTSEELDRLAERIVLLQAGHDQLQASGNENRKIVEDGQSSGGASVGVRDTTNEAARSVRKPKP